MGCNCKSKGPGSLKKLANFNKAIINFVKSGGELVTQKRRNARLDTCKNCPLYQEKGDLSTCRACGCYLYAKTWMASENCPKEFWPGESNENKRYEL